MSLERSGSRVEYSSRRLWPGTSGAGCRISLETGELQGSDDPGRGRPAGESTPGTFEHFLVERYVLYASPRPGRLLVGRVYHTPYPVRSARLLQCEQSLTEACGLPLAGPPQHVAFSDGVQVEVFSLRAALP
jgi:uncharacterized protein YqjF (DUF2071 family)